MNEIAWQCFKGLAREHMVVVREELNSDIGGISTLAKLTGQELCEFIIFRVNVHKGANYFGPKRYGANQVSQKEVIDLAEKHGIDWRLLEAQARYELSPKRFEKEHKLHLENAESGKPSDPPKRS